MIRSFCLSYFCLLLVLPTHSLRAEPVDYVRDIKPILKQKCYSCHGALEQEAELRLDTVRSMREGGDSGAAVKPGDASDSLLLQRITAESEGERMPPEGEPLTAPQVDLVRRWITQGASAPADERPQSDPRAHWAFQPIQAVEVSLDGDNADNIIDAFIRRRLHEHDLDLAAPAEDVTLIRRMFLDLHGLPPTPDEISQWSRRVRHDRRAVSELVDYLLASPRYGERWAQHWLDIVRYADTHGYEVNTPRANAWPYRDYVIRAFNEDKPYDSFVLEQLAGDQVGADAATGFLVAAPVLLPGQIGKDEASKRLARQDSLDEIIVGTGATFLGLTIGCARCHDHKFDPITQDDYYAMQAFFAGVEYGDREIRDAEQQRKKELKKPRYVYGGTFKKPDVTHVLYRGDPEQPQETIGPRVPKAIGSAALPTSASEQERRTALAEWIIDAENPLTARVMVNRIWQYHFGNGLVDTPSDFGLNGATPSHPELLDWLAAEFIRSGRSVKHIHRLILTSRTYQQSSRMNPHAQSIDSDCKLLWRFPTRRLEAEAIRDSMLQVSGSLNLSMGGPGFSFFKTRGGLSGFPPIEQFGANELRRMIYSHKIRMEPVPVFGAFDCPDAGQAMPKRSQSTTAIQALNLFNSPFVFEQAATMAQRIKSEAQDESHRQIDRAFQLAFGRSPTESEVTASTSVVNEHGLAALCRVLLNSNEFLFIP